MHSLTHLHWLSFAHSFTAGDEDGDALLVEPTHGRIEGYESKPAASPSAEGSRKVVEHEGDSITLGKRSACPALHQLCSHMCLEDESVPRFHLRAEHV